MTQLTNNKTVSQFASVLMILLPILTMATSFGMALTQVIILIVCIGLVHRGMGRFYAIHWPAIAWIVAGFTGYFLISVLRTIFTTPQWQPLDGPSRLLLGLSCIGFVGALRPSLRAFWIGNACGAIAAAAIAVTQSLLMGIDRVEGLTHHAITFGNLALMTGLLAWCGLPVLRHSRLAFLPPLGLLCGLLASLLSGSRGGWVALPFAALLLLHYGNKRYSYNKLLSYGGGVLALLLILASMFKHNSAMQRMGLIYTEIEQYYLHGKIFTSIGIRLELWKASWLMFCEHPWVGVGREGFDAALQHLVKEGKLQESGALVLSTSHNDILFFLASGGLLDFSFLLLMYLGPLLFFHAALRKDHDSTRPAALAGMVLVVSFIMFGLTDVMFWLMATKSFYVMMVCILTGYCLAGLPRTDQATANN